MTSAELAWIEKDKTRYSPGLMAADRSARPDRSSRITD
jgi:hypothetical protein